MSKDATAIGMIKNSDALHKITNYLYAPTREAACTIDDELKRRGFATTMRLGADGVNWLVLATIEAVPSIELIDSLRNIMEPLAADAGGEYDGWEVAEV